uniref:Immunoglobulin V-set domain-containing protein n=1 Tax=Anabas testudineus TaxID=64144 RepID=A0A3Q1IZA8_ANATE
MREVQCPSVVHMSSVSITQVSCSYVGGYKSNEKYLCRNDCGSDNDVLITTTQGSKNRYSISDDTNKRVFTATISNLNKNDAGKYWCGVMRIIFITDNPFSLTLTL